MCQWYFFFVIYHCGVRREGDSRTAAVWGGSVGIEGCGQREDDQGCTNQRSWDRQARHQASSEQLGHADDPSQDDNGCARNRIPTSGRGGGSLAKHAGGLTRRSASDGRGGRVTSVTFVFVVWRRVVSTDYHHARDPHLPSW